MGTHNETLADDISQSTAFSTIASMDQNINEAETGCTAPNNQDATTETLTDDISQSTAFSTVASMDQTINAEDTSLDDSFTAVASLLYNTNLTSLSDVAEFFKIGTPVIFSERDDDKEVIFYERAADKPVIFSDGAYGIERTINAVARILYAMHRKTEESTPTVESSKAFSKITIDDTSDESDTVVASFSTSVA